jgi:K+-transporting ATPase ATPase C chain
MIFAISIIFVYLGYTCRTWWVTVHEPTHPKPSRRRNTMWKNIRISIILLAIMTVLTGLLYPAAVTLIAQALFPSQANGSMILRNGHAMGSELIGQQFDDPRYFWGRLSATGPIPYNAAASTGSNFGPGNPALLDAVKARVQALQHADSGNVAQVPVDLATASGSGLDPHISVAAALYQLPRVARLRGMSTEAVRGLIDAASKQRDAGLLGEARVNVLALNLSLDALGTVGGKAQ